jgi:hypothetical protein
VICYNVIEHVPDVEAALLNFCESLKPNGMILIGAPNPRSLSGVVTKYSPHWFHVWFYRHVRGDKKAGCPATRRSRRCSSAGHAFQPGGVRRAARPANDLPQAV